MENIQNISHNYSCINATVCIFTKRARALTYFALCTVVCRKTISNCSVLHIKIAVIHRFCSRSPEKELCGCRLKISADFCDFFAKNASSKSLIFKNGVCIFNK